MIRVTDDPRPSPDVPDFERVPCPFVIIEDDREGLPYKFRAIRNLYDRKRRYLDITTKRARLKSGDYSILGFEERVAVERKSKTDLFSTLGQGRERFILELERLARMPFAAVVVEAEWLEILTDPPSFSQLNPKTVFHSVNAWTQRYPGIHWFTVPGRDLGEQFTFRILERWYRDNVSSVSSKERKANRGDRDSRLDLDNRTNGG